MSNKKGSLFLGSNTKFSPSYDQQLGRLAQAGEFADLDDLDDAGEG